MTNGLPFNYKLLIILKGWKEVESEKFEDGGTVRIYTKNDAEITFATIESSMGIMLARSIK
ncbi:hypothetical protein I6G82_08175 [Lysinibacillus macroides]|uniref:Uncharacterized protein n=1 Tax=Lysinibacillus macroides TaxID=33935 RepID=A0A0N0CVE0_9BACI|nr:hypothetical protein [Lysinibacillus macroides]KOY81605.1 hypothetical protein ADM90_14520 [Lysinibacillus macroides]QPR69549.1 hypothetical protein I6G82_08175 [Lysinibacillus macroides]